MVYWRGAQPPISVLWPQFWLATLGDLSDVLLLNVARLNQASGGMLATLIAARLLAVGFGIEPYADAAAFFEPFADIIKRAMRQAPQLMTDDETIALRVVSAENRTFKVPF